MSLPVQHTVGTLDRDITPYGFSLKLMVCLLLAAVGPGGFAHAQVGRWDYQEVNTPANGYDKYSPQVQIDRWGNTHMVWGTFPAQGAGLQLFYATDATGEFSAPIQATNIGTIVDSTNAAITASVFKLDSVGRAHIAFLANVGNRVHLFYTNNFGSAGEFNTNTPVMLADQVNYDMAVDSTGIPHVAWLSQDADSLKVYYWNLLLPVPVVVGSLPGNGFNNGVHFGYPEVEASRNGVKVVFRTDGSAIYYLEQTKEATRFTPIQKIPLPRYDTTLARFGRSDLRLRMALDSGGSMHIIAPQFDSTTGHRLLYMSNATGSFSKPVSLTPGPLDSLPLEFDIAGNGAGRIGVVWSTLIDRPLAPYARVGYGELLFSGALWNLQPIISDLNTLIPAGYSYQKNGVRLAMQGDRVIISGLRTVTRPYLQQQAGLYIRTSLRPRIRYILPDAAAAGMNLVVETYAHFREKWSLGSDGFNPDSVNLELAIPADASRVLLGPSVVSWSGRLVSTMVYVKPGAAAGPVPIRIRVGGAVSNVDTFFVVTPQSIGRLSGGGFLGSGGTYGRRSKRGVMVVDSLILSSGTYRFDTTDTDPATPGNQGFLPVTILSRGPIRIDSGAVLSVSGRNDSIMNVFGTAGPGGGGGGSGGEIGAGSGFTGGGGPGHFDGPGAMGVTMGSGGDLNGRWVAGPSLSGAPGGAIFPEGSAGGGTGHPFGSSGAMGQVWQLSPIAPNSGGSGGGAGGSKALSPAGASSGGGGGANGTSGTGGGATGEANNAGNSVGCKQLVPLAGGSGGGGGGYAASGFANGGGGGGALSLVSYGDIVVNGNILANGANGINGPQDFVKSSGGGGGAGGSVLVSAKGTIVFGSQGGIFANGGKGGRGSSQDARNGGDGGSGRIRVDGHLSSSGHLPFSPPAEYSGPATAASSLFPAQQGTTLRGYGNPGSTIRVLIHPENGSWSTVKDVVVADSALWTLKLGPEAAGGMLYVAAMQRVDQPLRKNPFAYEPDWVLSPAGGNVLGRPGVNLATSNLSFPCMRFDSCATLNLPVANTGQFSDLQISNIRIVQTAGKVPNAFSIGSKQLSIAAQTTKGLPITFCPADTGTYTATLVLPTNVIGPDSVKYVTITGCALSGTLAAHPKIDIDLGKVCIGECRDTVVVLRNDGLTSLTVTAISAETSALSVSPLSQTLPFTIDKGDSIPLKLQLCMKQIEPAGARMIFRSTTIDSIYTLVVHGVNVGPVPRIPATIDFGDLTLKAGDSCGQRLLTIRNMNMSAPLRVHSLLITAPQFTLLDPLVPDTDIPPGDSISLRMQMCPGVAGDFRGQAILELDGGNCTLDTIVRLTGRAALQRAQMVILEPEEPRTINFPPTLLNVETTERTIVLKNGGNATAYVNAPVVATSTNTTPSEILLDSGALHFVYSLPPDSTMTLGVRLKPATLGPKEGRVIFSDDAGWSDTVHLFGQGIEPGLQVDQSRIEFSSVRLGDSSLERKLVISNSGTAPVRVNGILPATNPQFIMTGSSRPLPADLQPGGGDALELRFVFKPVGEGDSSQTIVIDNDSPQKPGVTLHGIGVLEHLAASPAEVQFGCVSPEGRRDSVNAITLRNTGSYRLIVNELPILDGMGAFMVVGADLPDTISPGQAHSYAVRYTAAGGPVAGTLRVKSSAPEQATISFSGDVCNDTVNVAVSIPDGSERTQKYYSLPVMVTFDRSLSRKVDYTLKLSYAYDLLSPLVFPRNDARPPDIVGTASIQAAMTENPAGQLAVTGTIDPSATGSGILVRIPMFVLLGSTYTTSINVTSFTMGPGPYKVSVTGGTFHALDCDTNGAVIIGGNYALDQNVPNPFGNSTVINYEIAHHEHVLLKLYDGMGTIVRTLVDEVQDQGFHQCRIDATTLPSGMYFYELTSGTFHKALWMEIAK